MNLDPDKIDRAVLALLPLGMHGGDRVWKGFDWDSLGRLHEKGFISDPHGKAKSVVLINEGLQEGERLLTELYSVDGPAEPRPLSQHVYAVIRYDSDVARARFTVKEIVATQAIAEAEVDRLNRLNVDKDCVYSWQVTRLFPPGLSSGDRKGETA